MALPEIIELRSPDGKRITAALKRNGQACAVTCRFARVGGDPNFFYEFAAGDLPDVPTGDAEFRLVDEDGGLWPRGDVEWASMPGGR